MRNLYTQGGGVFIRGSGKKVESSNKEFGDI